MRRTNSPPMHWLRRLWPITGAALLLALAFAAREGGGAPYAGLLSRLDWRESSPDFGGLSGLAFQEDGKTFVAVSDRGFLYQGRLTRDADGRLTGAGLLAAARFLDNFGALADGFKSDAEAVRIAADGSVLVAFESYARVARITPPDMMPKPLHVWDRFRALWGNTGMEALALDDRGHILAILEGALPGGSYPTLAYRGGDEWVDGPALPSDGLFGATDADFGPDGRLYVLERSFSVLWGYRTRISAYSPAANGFGPAEIVLLTGAGDWGDFEGMDVWTDPKGRMVATLVADNNFLPLSPTTIAEFDLTAKAVQSVGGN